jgi:hypothetical protein
MTKLKLFSYAFVGLITVGTGSLVSSSDAEAKLCRRVECVARAPFVCKGPIGSCGFQQGVCTKWKYTVRFVPSYRSCSGPGPVVR